MSRNEPSVKQRGVLASFVVASIASTLGDVLAKVAIPLMLYKLTRSPVSLGISIALTYVPYTFFGLIAGTVVDRFNRWWLLIAGEILQCLVVTGLAALQWTGTLQSGHLYLAVFLVTTLSIPCAAASAAVLPSIVPQHRLLQANNWLTGGQTAAEAAGPALAVVLLAATDETLPLAGSAAIFVISTLLLLLAWRWVDATQTVPDQPAVPTFAGTVWSDIKSSLAYIWRNPLLRSISLLAVVVNVFAPTVNAQFVVYATDILLLPDSTSGLLLTVGAIGAIATLPLISFLRRWLDYEHLLVAGYVAQGITVIVLAVIHQPVLGLIVWAVFSGTATIQRVLALTLRQHIVEQAIMGRVFATSMTIAWAVIPLGVLAGGFAAEALGLVTVFIVAGIGILTTTAVFHRAAGHRVRTAAAEHGL